jgi:hypothetical protein
MSDIDEGAVLGAIELLDDPTQGEFLDSLHFKPATQYRSPPVYGSVGKSSWVGHLRRRHHLPVLKTRRLPEMATTTGPTMKRNFPTVFVALAAMVLVPGMALRVRLPRCRSRART